MSRGASGVSSRADDSIALLGSPSTTSLDPACCACRRWVHGWPPRFTFVLTNGRGDSIDVKAVGSADLLAQFVEFIDDGVAALHDGFLVGSSSGVQMMGGLRPSDRQTDSMVLRMVAFAGRAPRRTSSFAKRVAASVRGRTEMPCSARSRRARRSGSPPRTRQSRAATLAGGTRRGRATIRALTLGGRPRWHRDSGAPSDS